LPDVLRERAKTHPDKVFLDSVDEGVRFTYAEMLAQSETIARALLDARFCHGDRAVIMAGNSADMMLTWFGCNLGGLVEVPINTAYRGSFLEHQVSTIAARVAFVDPEYAGRFVESRKACSAIEQFYVYPGQDQDEAIATLTGAGWAAGPFEALRGGVRGKGGMLLGQALPEVTSRDLAAIFFTSGTTGLSKGVTMTHAHMYFFGDEYRTMLALGDDDVDLTVLPLFHANAQTTAAYPAMLAGGRFVLKKKFSASGWIDTVRETGATATNMLAMMMDVIWKQPRRHDDANNDLRVIVAIPTAWSIADQFKERFGIEFISEAYGLTESPHAVQTPYGADRPVGAAGLHVKDWFDIRLVDPATEEEVPPGQPGEMLTRPKVPWITTQGYWGMPDKTIELFGNLWLHTGDCLRRDENGWFYFVDRMKDAVRRRGENISSYEVESAILAHDAIAECAAIAVPAAEGDGWDDEILMVIQLNPGALWDWAQNKMPAFTIPRYVKFVDQLPKTPTERIEKAKLRQWWLTHRNAQDRQDSRWADRRRGAARA
jgi:crotonobetaine/carnitine-CoA ligase